MNSRNVIWTPVVREKLIEFRNERFTPEETLNYISQIIIETEEFLRNPVIGKTYTEEFGRYKGISRIIISREYGLWINTRCCRKTCALTTICRFTTKEL
jgi:hypothetical protein